MKKNRSLFLILSIFIFSPARAQTPNTLTDNEQKQGWKLLFDGKTFNNWQRYDNGSLIAKWEVADGTIHIIDKTTGWDRKDELTTDENFGNFDLKIDWKVAFKGKSGILFRVDQDQLLHSNETGLQMEVLDNNGYPDRKNRKIQAGDLYGLISLSVENARPAGEWNHAEIYCNEDTLNFYLNGAMIVSTTLWTNDWISMVKNSTLSRFPGYGRWRIGKIVLQDRGLEVWYRNIKIRRLAESKQSSFQNYPGNSSQQAAASNGQTSNDNGQATAFIVPGTLPPSGVFDQRHLPASAIIDWADGVDFIAQGKYPEAIAAYERAAAQGSADAAFEIGCLAQSNVFKKDSALAVQWFRFAGTNGNRLAEYRLAIMTLLGNTSEPRDTWFSLDTAAANLGSLDAAMQLVYSYSSGTGIEADPVKADYWRGKIAAMKAKAYPIVNTDDIKLKMGRMIDDAVKKVEDVFILADPSLKDDRTPDHRVKSIEVTKFTGHFIRTGAIDESQPFEIECLVTPDPWFMPWNFRINNVIFNGTSILVVSRMSWLQQVLSTGLTAQQSATIGSEYKVGIHDLLQ